MNIEHNYSKYHIEIDTIIAQKHKDYRKILTTKKHKNQHKQHNTIIENTIIEMLLKKNHIQNDIQL